MGQRRSNLLTFELSGSSQRLRVAALASIDYIDIKASEATMASIVIRNLDDRLKSKLRVRAAQHGRSMEEEARHILRSALTGELHAPTNLYAAIRSRIAPLGGVELEIPGRQPLREPPQFD